MDVMEMVTDRAIRSLAKVLDDQIREALGKWVSEVDPEIVCDGSGNPIGIGAKGHCNPIIPIRRVEFRFTCGGIDI